MTQLALDLKSSGGTRDFDTFVPGSNHEALALLRALAAGSLTPALLHLCGPTGSGKSHLALALAGAVGKRARLLTADSPLARFAVPASEDAAASAVSPLWIVDDVERLDDPRQQALFAVVEAVRAVPGRALLTTASQPPLGLNLRDDLRSRLGWGLVVALAPLTDQDKGLALQALAADRGVIMSAEVVSYLLTHTSRDMRRLTDLFDALDRLALQQKRAITVPLVRELLQSDQ